MIIRLVFLLILCGLNYTLSAQENNSSKQNNDGSQSAIDVTDDAVEVVSPLIAKDNPRPRAIVSSLGLDPDKALIPVTVISINEYVINPLIEGYNYHLAPGSYELLVQPDTGTLLTASAAYASFEAKTYRLEITQNAKYLIGARIIDTDDAKWDLQLFQLQQQVAIPSPE